MKRSLLIGAAAALMTVAGVGVASAQSAPVGVSIRAGLFFPTSSEASNRGNTWFAFGAQYKLTDLSKGGGVFSHLDLSLDYFSRDDVSATPLLLNYVVNQGSVFGSVGVGAAFARAYGDSTTRFAYQIGVGYSFEKQIQVPVFLEAKFWGTDESRFDGVGVYLGYHF